MQKKLKLVVFLSLWTLIVIHSCKPSDTSPPVVTIERPNDGQQVSAEDTILVRATITDNERIEQWLVTLTDAHFAGIGQRIEFRPGGQHAQIELEYVIPAILESGTYYLRVSATDGESGTNQFAKLHVSGIPRERIGLVAIVESGGQYAARYRPDSAGWITIADLGPEFAGAGISSETQRLVTGGSELEPMRVFDLNTMLPVYQRTCNSALGDPCISTIASDGSSFFMGKYEGRLASWSAAGQLELDFALHEFRYPRSLYFQDNRIFCEEYSTTGPNHHWTSYHASNGAPIQEILLEGSFVGAFPVAPNQTLIVTNHQGMGRLRYYFFNENGYQLPIPGPNGPISSAVQISGNKYFYGQPDGIYSIDLSLTNNLLFKPGVSPMIMRYDDLGNELLAASETLIRAYDASSGDLRYTSAPGGNIVDFFVWYTR